jgi:hypothetical protein
VHSLATIFATSSIRNSEVLEIPESIAGYIQWLRSKVDELLQAWAGSSPNLGFSGVTAQKFFDLNLFFSRIIVNSVTKSGGNHLHGELYFDDRDAEWGAANAFTTENVQLTPGGAFVPQHIKPTDVRKQYGGAIGGPIIKDKLFFFFAADDSSTTSRLWQFRAIRLASSPFRMQPFRVERFAARRVTQRRAQSMRQRVRCRRILS